VKNLSDGRIAKYIFALIVFRRHLTCNFREAARPEIEKVVLWLNSHGYTPKTRADMKVLLRIFYRWVRHGNTDKKTPYPPEVAWIETGLKPSEDTLPVYLTEGEVKSMIDNAPSLRDRAIIAFDYEAGYRVSELLGLQLRDLHFEEHGVRIAVRRGKTGARSILLIACVPLLTSYLQNHPRRDESDAPAWIHFGTRNKYERLSYAAFNKMLRETAKKAGVAKKVSTHTLRHSAATRDAKFLTYSELCAKFGWRIGSRMPQVYIHLAGSDLDAKIIAMNTGKPVEVKTEFRPIPCPRCGEKGTPGQRFCPRCGSPLDEKELAGASVQYEELKKQSDEIKSLLEKALASRGRRISRPPQARNA
jgi:integrase/recombinase XerD